MNDPEVYEKDESLPLYQRAWETDSLYDRIKAMQVGDVVTYAELESIVNIGVQQGRGKGYLRTAVKAALNEDRMVVDVVRNVGITRLSDEQIVKSAPSFREKLQRASNRAIKRMTLGVRNYDGLANEMKIKHNLYVSQFGALRAMSSKSTSKKIECRVEAKQKQIDLQTTVDAFMNMKKVDNATE